MTSNDGTRTPETPRKYRATRKPGQLARKGARQAPRDSKMNAAYPEIGMRIEEAADAGDLEIVRLHLAYPNKREGIEYDEALLSAVCNGHTEVVRVLLEDGRADPAMLDNSPIQDAVMHGHKEIVRLLLADKRVDPAAGHNNALMCAGRRGYTEIVDMLSSDPRIGPQCYCCTF